MDGKPHLSYSLGGAALPAHDGGRMAAAKAQRYFMGTCSGLVGWKVEREVVVRGTEACVYN